MLLIFGIARLVSAKTFVVNADDTGDFSEIQPAINAAQPGDAVLIAPSPSGYVVNIPLSFLGKAISDGGMSDAQPPRIQMSRSPLDKLFHSTGIFWTFSSLRTALLTPARRPRSSFVYAVSPAMVLTLASISAGFRMPMVRICTRSSWSR